MAHQDKPLQSALPPLLSFLFIAALCSSAPALSASAQDKAEMQRQLNAETMQKPFAVEDATKVDAYVTEAMKKNLQPRQAAPSYWQPGYTCDSYYRNHYNYIDYRDCIYYHRYYGRYW
jgi:Ni/Co efflux regulator RcnB